VRPDALATPTDLRAIADVVQRLDGMPLAIELAAGRLSTFSLPDLRDRLDRSLDLLGGARPSGDPRHRTLRATIEWSYRLLGDDERRLFRSLSVFPDGVDLATAERVASDVVPDGDPGSVLARLVDTSMVQVDFEGGPRYRMLETLRAFGLDRLRAAGEDDAATQRLLTWAVELCGWIAETLTGEDEAAADAAVRRELPNLREAWRLARTHGALDVAVAMVIGLYDAITYRDMIEMRGWAQELAADPALLGHPRAAAVLGTAAEATYQSGQYDRAEQLARAGLERAASDTDTWFCLSPLSVADLARGAYAETIEHSLAAAASAPGARENLGIAALAAAYGGDQERARELNERGRTGARSPTMRAWGHYVEGEIDNAAGRHEAAERHYLRAIDLARSAGANFLVGVTTVGLVTARASAGRVHEALSGFREVVDYFARTGNWTHQWVALRNLAVLLRRLGDDEPADLIEAAAQDAHEAPVDRARAARPTIGSAFDKATVLAAARGALDRQLVARTAEAAP
jgi:tetratricopeptide (TPR) repeat protein